MNLNFTALEIFVNPGEKELLDSLIREASNILERNDLNNERENLSNVFLKIARCIADGSHEERSLDEFNDLIIAMASLNFRKRRSATDEARNLQNFFSYGLNMLNEELEERVFPKRLLSLLLNELPLQNYLIVSTDLSGTINLFHAGTPDLFPAPESVIGQNVKLLFKDADELDRKIRKEGIENAIAVELALGYTGPAKVKIVNPSWFEISEGTVYVIEILTV